MNEQRNIIIAVVVSLAILIGWQLYLVPTPEEVQQQINSEANGDTAPRPDGAGQVPGIAAGFDFALPREEALAKADRVIIDSPRLSGSVNLTGARFDDIVILDHKVSTEPEAASVSLFLPQGTAAPYYAEFGWATSGNSGLVVPNQETVWTPSAETLTPEQPVTLSWDNGAGLVFQRTISIDENYMLSVEQSVTNTTGELVTLFPWGLVNRTGTPQVSGLFILHEGLIGVFGDALEEVDYDDLQDAAGGRETWDTTGGWIGITDKYWLAALVPDQDQALAGSFTYSKTNNKDRYQADYLYDGGISIAPNTTEGVTNHLFAGAKEVTVLDSYVESLGIVNFDLAVDFGWFYWITKPLFWVIHYLFLLTGNFGLAIIAVTVLVKIAFFPLANTSYRSMSRMRKLQPKMMELKERIGDDREAMSKAMMQLYKDEKVNPMAGCVPILLQIPVFFALYKVLFVTIEMRHAPFYGWITDLSVQDPTSFWNLFGLIPWSPELYLPDFLLVGVLPLIMGFTMFLQQKLNPQPMDETQKRIFQLMPIFFTFLLATFPAGLVIYWTINNILSIVQQWVIMKRDKSL